MAPVAKSNHPMTLPRNEKGQISIFFSASLVVLVSIIAFVINVGLFVKAKINLQNATDAAAYAGAAVQARQLTKIAYLNWEMRNIYKEWMYKYYVIGSLNVPAVETPNSNAIMDFRLAESENAITGAKTSDPYNFPAVCIHIAGSQTNVCKRFSVPGLPEFGGYNIPGTEEASRSFMDSLIGTKINDCVERSKLNMLVASTWAYNVLAVSGDDTLAGRGPAIMADRQGAWPRAIELAMRIRNLEKVVNRPAETKGICRQTGISTQTNCTMGIDQIESQNFLGNERIVKAFYSAFRNLGSTNDREMKDTFTLTEIPPKLPQIGTQYNNSNLLIPENQFYQKQFLDLKLMMVNYATFYAALIPRADTATSGACDISKVAIPIPGYPLGFYKNPDVLTYYAIRGEAEFIGMFNPFKADTIKLTAYSAAKPFGGRIGPMLFFQPPDDDAIRVRTDNSKQRSVPYISSLDVVGTSNPFLDPPKTTLEAGDYAPGAPLPLNLGKSFWLESTNSPIGGLASGEIVQFGIPNMVYDFTSGLDANTYTDNGSDLFTIVSKNGYDGDKSVGLYNRDQFTAFRGNISGTVTQQTMLEQIARVRAPTNYEAANYLIPTPFEFNINAGVDSFGFTGGNPKQMGPGVVQYDARIYAPLYRGNNNQQDLLFGSADDVLKNIFNFMRQQKSGMDNYVYSLNAAAIQVYKMKDRMSQAAIGSADRYKLAAQKISDIAVDDTGLDPESVMPGSCDSLAGQFYDFYYGASDLFPSAIANKATCATPLGELLRTYFSSSVADANYDPLYYRMEYSLKENNFQGNKLKVFSAYMPGPFNGVGEDGVLSPPFPDIPTELMRRNFYSTKFVTLDSLRDSGNYNEAKNFVIYSEGNLTTNPGYNRSQKTFSNSLDSSNFGDMSSIKY